MNKIKSLVDLKQFRREYCIRRDQDHRPKIIVGMGTCGIAAGAKDIMAVLVDEVALRNIPVNIYQTGCIGMCEQEPLLDVQLWNQERVTYGKVTPELVREIVFEHIKNGRIVEKAALGRLTGEE